MESKEGEGRASMRERITADNSKRPYSLPSTPCIVPVSMLDGSVNYLS